NRVRSVRKTAASRRVARPVAPGSPFAAAAEGPESRTLAPCAATVQCAPSIGPSSLVGLEGLVWYLPRSLLDALGELPWPTRTSMDVCFRSSTSSFVAV